MKIAYDRNKTFLVLISIRNSTMPNCIKSFIRQSHSAVIYIKRRNMNQCIEVIAVNFFNKSFGYVLCSVI